jgi:hypothetical protein
MFPFMSVVIPDASSAMRPTPSRPGGSPRAAPRSAPRLGSALGEEHQQVAATV